MNLIKFRFWSKKENQFITLPRVWVGVDGLFQYEYGDGQELVIQRYTGLKDDKDQEIYEGDVVNYKFSLDSFFKEGEVKFSPGCFGVGKFLLWDLDYIEIIGNIFENPELLS